MVMRAGGCGRTTNAFDAEEDGSQHGCDVKGERLNDGGETACKKDADDADSAYTNEEAESPSTWYHRYDVVLRARG